MKEEYELQIRVDNSEPNIDINETIKSLDALLKLGDEIYININTKETISKEEAVKIDPELKQHFRNRAIESLIMAYQQFKKSFEPNEGTPLLEQNITYEQFMNFIQKNKSVFECPIYHELLKNPVVVCDGHTFEKSYIDENLSQPNLSPMGNGIFISKDDKVENKLLSNIIQTFLKQGVLKKDEDELQEIENDLRKKAVYLGKHKVIKFLLLYFSQTGLIATLLPIVNNYLTTSLIPNPSKKDLLDFCDSSNYPPSFNHYESSFKHFIQLTDAFLPLGFGIFSVVLQQIGKRSDSILSRENFGTVFIRGILKISIFGFILPTLGMSLNDYTKGLLASILYDPSCDISHAIGKFCANDTQIGHLAVIEARACIDDKMPNTTGASIGIWYILAIATISFLTLAFELISNKVDRYYEDSFWKRAPKNPRRDIVEKRNENLSAGEDFSC